LRHRQDPRDDARILSEGAGQKSGQNRIGSGSFQFGHDRRRPAHRLSLRFLLQLIERPGRRRREERLQPLLQRRDFIARDVQHPGPPRLDRATRDETFDARFVLAVGQEGVECIANEPA
jgi:hypothetical protein